MNQADCPCKRRGFAALSTAEDELATDVASNTAAQRADGTSALRSIGIGVATGLTVWFLTRFIDGRRRRRR